ncbi:MAG: hypothetical protein VX498_14650 [Myxococcota bacterium]|nr:hypothetical protein [Myxococcota bacterium]
MNTTKHPAARIAFSVLLLLTANACFVQIDGEMGFAEFEMEGGINNFVSGSWEADTPIARGTILSVEARSDEDLGLIDLRSSNLEVLIPYSESEEPAEGDVGFFQAVGTGRVAIELIDVTTEELLDFYTVDVEVVDAVRLLRRSGQVLKLEPEAAPDSFGVLDLTPVSLGIELRDSTDHVMNHHHAATASSADEAVLSATAGGTIVLLEGSGGGNTELTVSTVEDEASASYEVHSLGESEITQLLLRETGECHVDTFILAADLSSADDLPVLGVPVSWQVTGAQSVVENEDYIQVSYDEDEFEPITVTAVTATLTASFNLTEAHQCPETESSGCSMSSPAQGENLLGPVLLGLMGLPLLLRRRTHR